MLVSSAMIEAIGAWSQFIAAGLYGGLALWQLRLWSADRRTHPLTTAFAIVAAWMVFVAVNGPNHLLSGLAESARNIAFLAFMHAIAVGRPGSRTIGAVYGAVAAVVGLQLLIACLLHPFRGSTPALLATQAAYQALGLTASAGALVLVHNLYSQAGPASRQAIRLPMLALAAMWTYDLHLYTVAYLTREMPADLVALRGAILALVAPFFLAAGRKESWSIELSRAATFQSLSLLAVFAYLILMMSATRALEYLDATWVDGAQTLILLAMTATLLFLIPSRRIRAWLRVKMAKHFFQHRYDYRAQWQRFTRTIGTSGPDALPIGTRIVKALAQAADAPGGVLLTVDPDGRFDPAAEWNWRSGAESWIDPDLAAFIARRAFVLDFGTLQPDGSSKFEDTAFALPSWTVESDAWAGVPLLHNDCLIGLVLLAPPPVRRRIDWEDIDLFRTAGVEAASYLAETQAQEALADARKFDEFNRRFAFIMHDIKNVLSQISLVARNAERHADNPEFRADMIATLQGSARKMTDLLARLSRGASEARQPRPTPLAPIIDGLSRAGAYGGQVIAEGVIGCWVDADAASLEQAMAHLILNGIEASANGQPVTVRVEEKAGDVAIVISDRGSGMSAEFIRTRLFQPFASTKDAGFGVGAYEARALVEAMGGRIDVVSREGEGSSFTVTLPVARQPAQIEESCTA